MSEHKRGGGAAGPPMEAGEKKGKNSRGKEDMKLPEGCERKGGKTLRVGSVGDVREKVKKLSGVDEQW